MKNNIKTARENKKLTQQECVEIFNVKLRAWQTYEQGVSEPKYELLCKIADTFGVSTDYLLGREEQPNPLSMLNGGFEEDKFIEKYRQLPQIYKEVLADIIDKLAK